MRGSKGSFVLLSVAILSMLFGVDESLLAGEGVSFGDPVDFTVGPNPQSVTTGDFNGDKVLDVAVANFGRTGQTSTVSILLGKGDGTFGQATEYETGPSAQAVVVGDFNGDKILDVAVGHGTGTDPSYVSVPLGKGDGKFGAPLNSPAGPGARSLAVGDFNRDGMLDLVVAHGATNAISVLLGRGDGTFEPACTITVGTSNVSAVAVGDFNKDGKLDLAVTNTGSKQVILGTFVFPAVPGSVSILLGQGDGTFGPARNFTVRTNPLSVAVGDLNGDQILDLAVANNFSDDLSILLGKGDGTFEPACHYPVGHAQVLAIDDFNGDGIPDVVTANLYGDISILFGQGDGTFPPPRRFWAGAQPVSVTVGDFDGDKRPDLAVVQSYSDQLSILLNNTPQLEDGVTVYRDVVYYQGPYANPQRQNLDVYVPPRERKANFPVVFLIYGGGHTVGDKILLGYLARTLAREGLEVVAINHRLTDGSRQQVVHPGHIVDVTRALAWTYEHIADYGGNPDQIILLGHSSGAHLVSLLATDRRYLTAQGLSPNLVKGVISVSARYDLREVGYPPVTGDQEQGWDASPLKHVRPHQPPFLILYGGTEVVQRQQGEMFYQAIIQAKSEAELHGIPDRNHEGIIGRAARTGDPARALILRFIAEHTK